MPASADIPFCKLTEKSLQKSVEFRWVCGTIQQDAAHILRLAEKNDSAEEEDRGKKYFTYH